MHNSIAFDSSFVINSICLFNHFKDDSTVLSNPHFFSLPPFPLSLSLFPNFSDLYMLRSFQMKQTLSLLKNLFLNCKSLHSHRLNQENPSLYTKLSSTLFFKRPIRSPLIRVKRDEHSVWFLFLTQDFEALIRRKKKSLLSFLRLESILIKSLSLKILPSISRGEYE